MQKIEKIDKKKTYPIKKFRKGTNTFSLYVFGAGVILHFTGKLQFSICTISTLRKEQDISFFIDHKFYISRYSR